MLCTAELNDFVTLDNVSYQNCHEYLPTDYTTDIQLPQRQNMDFIINEQGKCLIDLCIESKIRILNGRVMGDSLGSYTYYSSQGKSCIDYVISSENIVHMFNFINVLPPNELSDHCIIWFSLNCQFPIKNKDLTYHGDFPTYPLPGKFITENNKHDFINSLQSVEISRDIELFKLKVNDPDGDIDNLTEELTNIMVKAAKKSFQFKHFKHNKKKKKNKHEWSNGNCFFMKRELRNLGKRMQQNPNNPDIKNNYFRLLKEYKKTVKSTRKQFYNSMINKLDMLHENDPKAFWKTLDKLKGRSQTSNPINISEWHEYMSDLYNDTDFPSMDDIKDLFDNNPEIGPLDFPFTCQEVKKGVLKLKSNKQPGIDLIPNEFIKFGLNQLLLPIVNLFNKILCKGTFPSSWNISCTTFIHKNGDINDCDNYRCLSLTSCFGKLFTSLMQTRLHNYMDDNSLYNKFQAGFRPEYRTTDHIFTIKTILNKYLYKNKKQVFACFVDFSKAFDSVWRTGLFQKIKTLGITGIFFKLITNMYTNSKFVVKKDNNISHPTLSKRGVRQGDGLYPLLLKIFVNDIDLIFDKKICNPIQLNTTYLNCLLYADDLLLLSETENGLQSCLNSLQNYCNKWKLKVNINKTKVIIFSKGKKDFSKFNFSINGTAIEIVEKYKYLGIILYFNGNLKHAAEHLYNQSLKALFSIKPKILNSSDLNINLKLKLFDTLIRPICTYGSEIWISDFNINESNIDKMPFEKIQNKFCKYILNVNRKSSNLAAKCELGRKPVINFITYLAFKYFNRFKMMSCDRFLHEVFEVDKALFDEGHRSWFAFIDSSLKKFKLDKDDINIKTLLASFNDCYEEKINKKLEDLSLKEHDNKLFFFSNIYQHFQIQDYLSFNLPNSLTNNLTKLRISAHQLLIEKGRYFRPKIERKNRLCTNCNELEDEEHFLLYCEKFKDLRSNLFTKMNIQINDLCPRNIYSTSVLKILLNPTCKDDTIYICKFISTCFENR